MRLDQSYRSPNFNQRPVTAAISMVVFHYTGMRNKEAALARLCDPTSEVSCHYLIDEQGNIYQLVADAHRAWHAGISYWRGVHNINDCSIGIELVNPGHEFGYQPYPNAQIESLIELLNQLTNTYIIPATHFVGHSDIAPLRKQDPGHLFPWDHLSQHGFGTAVLAGPKHGRNQDRIPACAGMTPEDVNVCTYLSDTPSITSSLRVYHQSGVLDTVGMTEVSAITSSLRAPEVRSNPGKLLDASAKLTLARNDGGASSGLSLEASVSETKQSSVDSGLLRTSGARNDEVIGEISKDIPQAITHLQTIGYGPEITPDNLSFFITAFQRRFLPNHITGIYDAATQRMLHLAVPYFTHEHG